MAKSKYDPETFPALAEGYAREGMIDKEIAARLGVSEDSFYEYLKRHSEFSEAVKRGKAPVDFAVESALLRRALGGVRTETTRVNCAGRLVVSTEVRREVLPKHGGVHLLLRKRRPDKWRDPPGAAGEDAEHPQCPAEGWSPPPATEADAEGGRAQETDKQTNRGTDKPTKAKAASRSEDAPATTIPEQDAPATTLRSEDAPDTSLPEQDAPATTFPEQDVPATSDGSSEGIGKTAEEATSEAVLLAFAPEGGLVDAEGLGRLLERLCGGDDPLDVGLLQGVQRDLGAHLRRLWAGLGGAVAKASSPTVSPTERITARSTRLRSSRRFPGQGCERKTRKASSEKPRRCLWFCAAKNANIPLARSGMSSGRADKGGSSIWITFKR